MFMTKLHCVRSPLRKMSIFHEIRRKVYLTSQLLSKLDSPTSFYKLDFFSLLQLLKPSEFVISIMLAHGRVFCLDGLFLGLPNDRAQQTSSTPPSIRHGFSKK